MIRILEAGRSRRPKVNAIGVERTSAAVLAGLGSTSSHARKTSADRKVLEGIGWLAAKL